MEAFHIACYGNAPYWSGCTGHIMLMVLIPALCIVMLIAVAEFSTPVNKKHHLMVAKKPIVPL